MLSAWAQIASPSPSVYVSLLHHKLIIHTLQDDVNVEIPALKTAYLALQEETSQEDDIILLGDLNSMAPGIDTESYMRRCIFSKRYPMLCLQSTMRRIHGDGKHTIT
jgi:hypothetical protein